MPNNKVLYLLPTKLEMHFLSPIAPEDISSKELKENGDEAIKASMAKELRQRASMMTTIVSVWTLSRNPRAGGDPAC